MTYTVTEYWETEDRYEDITTTESLERGIARMQQISRDKRVQTLLTDEDGEIVRWCSVEGIITSPEED